MGKEALFTIKITQNGELKKEFVDQDSDMEAFKWMLRNQSNSIDWAIKYERWKIELINQNTKESTFWKASHV